MSESKDPFGNEIVEHRVLPASELISVQNGRDQGNWLEGWIVLESWEERVPVKLHTEERDPDNVYRSYPTGSYQPQQGMRLASIREDIGTRRLLLLGKTRDSLVDERDQEIRKNKNQVDQIHELQREVDTLKKQLEEEDKRVTSARDIASGHRTRAEDAERASAELRKLLAKIERHLAAVREQIGAKEFDRIVKEIDATK